MFWRRAVEKRTVAVKFDGELEEVSVDTFVSVLLGYSRVLQEAASEVEPGMRLDVNITATRPGCLEAILTAAMNDVPGLLGTLATMSGQISQVIDTTHKYLELRKFLGSNGAPKNIEKVGDGIQVTAGNNATINITQHVYNLSASPAASDAAESMFSFDEEDERVKRILIASDDVPTFAASRDEFPQIKTAPACRVGSERVELEERAYISVTRPVLETTGRRKWEFYYKGFRFTAKVVDREFLDRLGRREYAFGIGDALVADLEMRQALNEVGVWENKEVRVVKVHEVVSQPTTPRLDI